MISALFQQTTATFFVAVVSFILNIWLGRWLGPAVFGEYQSLLAIFSILMVLFDAGYSKLLFRERIAASPGWQSWQSLVAHAHAHFISFIVIVSLLLVIFGASYVYFFALATYALSILGDWRSALLRGERQFKQEALWQMLQRLTSATFIVLVVTYVGREFAAVTEIFIGWTAGLALAWLVFHTKSKYVFSVKFPIATLVYKAMLLMVLIDLCMTIYFRSDIILQRWHNVPSMEIGFYAAAFKFVEAFALAISPIAVVWFSRVRSIAISRVAILKIFKIASIALVIGCIAAALVSIIAQPLIGLVYGAAFKGSAPILSILAISFCFLFPSTLLVRAAFAFGWERKLALMAFVTAIFNVVFNIWLIPIYSIFASAWLAVATSAFVFTWLVILFLRLSYQSHNLATHSKT